MDANSILERRACVTGIGQSAIGRRLGINPLELTLDSCVAAVEDAGLEMSDIDGLVTYPGAAGPSGFSGAGAVQVHEALRLKLGWHDSGIEAPGQLGSVIKACLAVAAGLARHVLCFRSVWEGTAQGTKGRAGLMPGGGGRGNFRASGFSEWTLPFSAPSAAVWIAMFAQRHFHLYGTTREQMAQIALNARANAALNPDAIYRDPMTMDDYMSARLISTPFGLFDCDVPCDGSTAFVISHVDAARDLRHTPVRVEAVGTALLGRPSWDQFDDLSTMANRDAGAQLWTRTELTPSDVDIVEAYDGFSFLTMSWLEALGLVPVGESGPFVEGGQRIARDGELPLNTHGGQLSAGRLHGYGFLHEAVLQLRGEAGERQVTRKQPQVGIAAAGGGNTCGCLLLTRE
ncbi:thiolase family protein [Myxococcota bacterium]|nr:thiolase family protein [Myxococcota bacterium]